MRVEKDKLQDVIQKWPSGAVYTQEHLNRLKISRQQSYYFVKSGWLKKIGQGAFIKNHDHVTWEGGVYGLQKDGLYPIHIGGITALNLLGQSHFVPLGNQNINLYNTKERHPKRALPKWFIEFFKDHLIFFHRSKLFEGDLGVIQYDCGNFKINISCAERALIEFMYAATAPLDHAFYLMEGKHSLRSKLLQEILEISKHQQANRLFLHLAKRCDLPCFENLDLKRIDLGVGRRKIGEGGFYDPEFKLDLPEIRADDRNIEVEV